MSQVQTRYWPDLLRVLATCSVIFLHYAAPGTSHPVGSYNFWVGNVLDSAVRACVPLFVMLSGALVLPSDRPLGEYLSRRMSRILAPAAFWSLIYLLYNLYRKDQAEGPLGIGKTVKWSYGQLQLGTEFHLWYLYMIIGLYLFIPILGRWIRAAPRQEIHYFLVIWAVALFASYPLLYKFRVAIELQYFGGYIGYLVLGYYLAQVQYVNRPLAWLAIGIGFIITVVGTYYVTLQNQQFTGTYFNYLTPNVALMAAGIFHLVRNAAPRALGPITTFIAANSFTIYLSHALVLLVFHHNGINGYTIEPLLGIPLMSLICLAISCVIAWLIQKSPLARYIAG
ncbi:acyltransferase [Solirubrum puertoriconensis]|uniref:Acyltransferase 3 domain-containing protein n=1 Tax=Solirubrum puertoriconensis TaxID=1751427 RepID=A0A9X0L3U0_SOLP1|nr:acyltransferase family protein [Solirubrum puertoriconensis]KUG06876.1 hypothetical protein ASU33_06005 [Solirubrum puertoriconensis]